MKKAFEFIFSITPSIALTFAEPWVNLFKGTAILRPDVPHALVNTALALSVFLSIVVVLIGKSWDGSYKLRTTKNLLVMTLVLALVCYGSRLFLSWPRSRVVQSMITSMWDLCGWVFVVVAIMTVTFAALYAFSIPAESRSVRSG
ncbi:hypothetical protein NKH61_26890 [Mesorhizobium sp. M1005]|uniref:hypothetical protein n=1 Tax=unclassified Mesorhizobium TaxID=325217 RepID=UPI003336479B